MPDAKYNKNKIKKTVKFTEENCDKNEALVITWIIVSAVK